jgi:hypothetical protein
MRVNALAISAFCAAVTALAFPAGGLAATRGPIDHFHNVFADSSSVCGVDVAETETVSGVFTIVGNGVELNAYTIQNTWTNPDNGKSVEFHAAVLNEDTIASPVDNGDGTISVFFKGAGMEQVKSNGAILMQATGQMTAVLTVDATTFDFVSFRVLSSGGESPDVDICSAVVPALT